MIIPWSNSQIFPRKNLSLPQKRKREKTDLQVLSDTIPFDPNLCYGMRAVLAAGSVFHISAPWEETSECWHPVHVPDDTRTYRWVCWIQNSLQTKLHKAVPFNDAYTQLFLIATPRVGKHDIRLPRWVTCLSPRLISALQELEENIRREIMNTSRMELRRVWNIFISCEAC
jgi:hypothetical protein